MGGGTCSGEVPWVVMGKGPLEVVDLSVSGRCTPGGVEPLS